MVIEIASCLGHEDSYFLVVMVLLVVEARREEIPLDPPWALMACLDHLEICDHSSEVVSSHLLQSILVVVKVASHSS